jgi:hypothetical protein
MSDNVPNPWSNDPPAQEPSFVNPDAPTIQAFDSSSLPPAAPPPPPPQPPHIDYGVPPITPPPAKKKSNTWMWILLVVVLLLFCCCCAGLGGWALYTNQSSGAFGPSGFISTLLI